MDEFNNYQWNKDDFEKDMTRKGPIIFSHTQTYYTENYSQKKKKKRFPLNYITVAIISAIIGGLIFGATFAFMNPILNKDAISNAPKSALLPADDNNQNSSQRDTGKKDSGENNAATVAPKAVTQNNNRKELSVVDIAKKAGPAVVGIVNKVQTRGFIRETVEQGSGSGIIISADGYIITNNHVVDGASEVTVILSNGKKYDAKLIGKDPKTDLAVIKIDAKDLHYAELGDSSTLEVGELAVAIGNPLGQEFAGSVTVGVISALNRTIKIEGRQLTLIQTDAAINPGNSGGALVNSYGEVIGINTVKMAATGVEGLGFAIPINEAKPIIEQLIAHGYVKGRPLIGISGRDITSEIASMYNLPEGIYVIQVTPYSGAELAGIQPGDVITKFNGQPVKTMEELNALKEKFKAGDQIELEVNRQGEVKKFKVKLSEEK
ncbi:S1C family serine protease [Petroclostridium xylanilyticum]|uniref:S1C family serine protease n=1 Tax=Petroclostridium xylanilyticum TaxID=1792311 RepID=UPI001FA8631B|nr:trypsin-like peptidase domain-containing protein [Petroclostridium xylanilyticum]